MHCAAEGDELDIIMIIEYYDQRVSASTRHVSLWFIDVLLLFSVDAYHWAFVPTKPPFSQNFA